MGRPGSWHWWPACRKEATRASNNALTSSPVKNRPAVSPAGNRPRDPRENLAWTAAQMSSFKMVEAIGGFISGKCVGQTLELFGKRWTVIFGNLISATTWTTIGTASSTARVLFGTVLMYPFGVYLRPSVETALTKHADAAGIGQGMLQGQLANLVAVVKICAPPVYLQAYKYGMARGISAAPFLLYSFYFVLNAGLLVSVPLNQL
jgi:hypothetical protein